MRFAMKTASWSVTHMIVAIAVAYALTQNWRAALAVGLIEPIFQTIAFAVHERAWMKFAPARTQEAREGTTPRLAGSARA
ncbi:conserved hypothetical protein [Phenylobacterium zucineum HLK1]|uniref:DUF2061 domain-containing protein n=1 Tax=Phenylobacterium zucineum (strain HLK1) TaxID=450851 RepID=B4RAN4_PHEZH|nr:DUF2061 domain-containing protein [Phenylobacterium zucineum]ACG79632.1 conserved hypothetical protein [Phenylobacterium zucineum HLK1]